MRKVDGTVTLQMVKQKRVGHVERALSNIGVTLQWIPMINLIEIGIT